MTIRLTVTLGLMVGLSASLSVGTHTALAQGACCTLDDCLPAADELECSHPDINGVFLDGEDCASDPCAAGACCAGTNCATAPAYPCITAGRDFIGAGSTCATDPCDIGVGACCSGGGCSVISEDDCDAAAGT